METITHEYRGHKIEEETFPNEILNRFVLCDVDVLIDGHVYHDTFNSLERAHRAIDEILDPAVSAN